MLIIVLYEHDVISATFASQPAVLCLFSYFLPVDLKKSDSQLNLERNESYDIILAFKIETKLLAAFFTLNNIITNFNVL